MSTLIGQLPGFPSLAAVLWCTGASPGLSVHDSITLTPGMALKKREKSRRGWPCRALKIETRKEEELRACQIWENGVCGNRRMDSAPEGLAGLGEALGNQTVLFGG